MVVVFDGTPPGIMSFAFGVFDLARCYGALPGIDLRVVAGEPGAMLGGGDLTWPVPYDLDAVRGATADSEIRPFRVEIPSRAWTTCTTG